MGFDERGQVPAKTPESDAISKVRLEATGFKSMSAARLCYAFMQAVGMVNDHLIEQVFDMVKFWKAANQKNR